MKNIKMGRIILGTLFLLAMMLPVGFRPDCQKKVAIERQVAIGYEIKEAIPGQGRTSDFIDYLQKLYKFGIIAAVVLALFMIGVGAFNYIVTSAGNFAKMGDAKEMIFGAIFGLVMALISWLLLNTINPDLVGGGNSSVSGSGSEPKNTGTYESINPPVQGSGSEPKDAETYGSIAKEGDGCGLLTGSGGRTGTCKKGCGDEFDIPYTDGMKCGGGTVCCP